MNSELQDLLKSWMAVHPPISGKEHCSEQQALQTMLKTLHEVKEPFLRSSFPQHFTASAWILTPSRDKVALLLHRKLNKWVQPGGHADGDTDLIRVARREAEEETGLKELQICTPVPFDLDVHTIPARGAEPEHQHLDVRFLFVAKQPEQLKPNHESKELRWFLLEEVSEITLEESVMRMVRKSRSVYANSFSNPSST